MRERIEELAKEIRSAYERLSAKARSVRSDSLIVKTKAIPISLSICAVDGGLLSQRVHGADIVIARAAGAIFTYEDSKLTTFSYHPSKNPMPDIEMRSALDEHDAMVFRSLIRLKRELSCAISILEKHSPQMLILDGSLVLHPSDRPGEESRLRPLYAEVMALYSKLYEISKEKSCMLCGVIKDSRSRKLAKQLCMDCSDTLLCNYLLDEGERTREFGYLEESADKEAASIGGRIKVFYIKPSSNHLPLRIEALDADADHIASIIQSLSSSFAYPSVLIEADMCAALDPNEMESIESLLSLSGMKPLRRDSRPFR